MEVRYGSKLAERIQKEILENIEPGEVRRLRLESGLALAYTETEQGLLLVSREGAEWPSEKELAMVQEDFVTAAVQLNWPILNIREVERKVVQLRQQHYAVTLVVNYGKQERLL